MALVLKELNGGLWHTTSQERFDGILTSRAILPEPPGIPDRERWKTRLGAEGYPYVRYLGGVSLFDFAYFEPDSYDQKYPWCSWAYLIPYPTAWGSAVWIEIDREQAAPRFISGPNLLARWKSEEAYKHTIMPLIEAAYLGSLSRTAFKRAFLSDGTSAVQPLPLPD